jgi:hypothetical protein
MDPRLFIRDRVGDEPHAERDDKDQRQILKFAGTSWSHGDGAPCSLGSSSGASMISRATAIVIQDRPAGGSAPPAQRPAGGVSVGVDALPAVRTVRFALTGRNLAFPEARHSARPPHRPLAGP